MFSEILQIMNQVRTTEDIAPISEHSSKPTAESVGDSSGSMRDPELSSNAEQRAVLQDFSDIANGTPRTEAKIDMSAFQEAWTIALSTMPTAELQIDCPKHMHKSCNTGLNHSMKAWLS